MSFDLDDLEKSPRPPMFSLGKFIVEPYVSDRAIKTTATSGGFAMIQQKVVVKGLRLLVAAKLENLDTRIALDGVSQSGPLTIPSGSLIFIREEYLHSAPWAKQVLEAEGLGKFLIVDRQYVEFIQPV